MLLVSVSGFRFLDQLGRHPGPLGRDCHRRLALRITDHLAREPGEMARAPARRNAKSSGT